MTTRRVVPCPRSIPLAPGPRWCRAQTRSSTQPPCARARRLPAGLPPAVFAPHPAGEPPADRRRRVRQEGRHRGARELGSAGAPGEGDCLHSGARAAPGLHRRAGGRRSRDHARRDRRPRRRPEEGQPAAVGRARDRSLRAGGLLRPARRVRSEQPPRVPAQPRALRLPAVGPERLQQLPRRAARDRDRAPGQSRVPGARRLPRDPRRRAAGVPGHAGRHRLAHHDGERAGRGRLGRRRHRSRSGDAGPADLDADPRGARGAAGGRPARGGDGDRPRADGHRAAAQAGSGRQVRRVLRTGAAVADHRRSRDPRQHVARVRGDDRHLPDRRDDARLPAPHRSRSGAGPAGRGLHEGAGAVPDHGFSRGCVHGDRGRGSVDDRAQPGRAETPAGSRLAEAGEAEVRGRAGRDARSAEEAQNGGQWDRHRPHRGRDRRGGSDAAGVGGRARSRRGRRRRHHQLHQHLESQRDDRRRAAGQEGGRAGADAQALGQDQPRARARRSSRRTWTRPVSRPISRSWGSTWSATAARRASATAARCPTRSRRSSRSAT